MTPKEPMPELKPCPFCGGEASVTHHSNNFDGLRLMSVGCCAFVLTYETECYSRWNTRAASVPSEDELTIQDYEDVLTDNRRLVRELDVALNGDGAAKQASLCDIVAQVKHGGWKLVKTPSDKERDEGDPLFNKRPNQDEIEAIIIRRLREGRIDGYTIEMAHEIAALTAPDQTETIKALAAALENTTIVELPSETESYKYKVTMAMMPMADWERVEKALALAKKAWK